MSFRKEFVPFVSSKVEGWTEEGLRLFVAFVIGSALLLGLILHHLLDKK